MVSLVWDESFSVGNGVLDADHRILFDLVQQLDEATETGQSREVVGSIIGVVVEYTEHHFRREEALFTATAYPDAASHIAEHRAIEAKAAAIRHRWNAGEREAMGEELLALLKKWLTDHVRVVDKSYGPWLAGVDAADARTRRR